MKTSEVYFFHNTAAIWLEACNSKISNDITNLNDQTLFKCHFKLMLFGEQRVVDIFPLIQSAKPERSAKRKDMSLLTGVARVR